jgi:hypothetical protein
MTAIHASNALLTLAGAIALSIASPRQSLAVFASILLAWGNFFTARPTIAIFEVFTLGKRTNWWIAGAAAIFALATAAVFATSVKRFRPWNVLGFAWILPLSLTLLAPVLLVYDDPALIPSASFWLGALDRAYRWNPEVVAWANSLIVVNLCSAGLLFAVAVFGFDRLAGRHDKDRRTRNPLTSGALSETRCTGSHP